MARSTATLVREINIDIEDTVTDAAILPFITIANAMITDIAEPEEYSESYLTLMETWLSAHFYCINVPKIDTEKADVVMQKNQYEVGLNLNVTTYGQQVIIMDYLGAFARLQQQAENGFAAQTPGVFYLGTDPDTRTA